VEWPETTVVVTGATRGIGLAVVEVLCARGARVGCVARSAKDLDELRARLAGAGTVATAPADVSDRSATRDALAKLRTALGPVDVLVNNAGIGLYGPVADLDPDRAEQVMRVNYLGMVHATCSVLPEMLTRGRGHVVNVASIAGRLGAPFEAAYSASKFAVVGFSEALAVEVAPLGVTVSLVNPGPVETSFFEARGHPYTRRRPKPIAAGRVAKAVLEAVEHRRPEQVVPASLSTAVVLRHLFPYLFRAGTRRAFQGELARLSAQLGRAPGTP
jgi:short-subunit dehydrogenase